MATETSEHDRAESESSSNGQPPEKPSGLRARSWGGILKRTVREFKADNVTDWAAALTYYGVLAIFPAIIALVSVLGLIGHSATQPLITNLGKLAPALVLCLLALSTTLPPALLSPAAAAIAVASASVVSLLLFNTLTVAAFAAQLIVLYRFGSDASQRHGAQLMAVGLAVPFPELALAELHRTSSEAVVLTLLLASLAPAAVWAGSRGGPVARR